jgi:hypothetical protein
LEDVPMYPGAGIATDKNTIIELLDIREGEVKIDRYAYTPKFPDEVKAWRFIGKNDPALRKYQNTFYFPPSGLMSLLDQVTELLYRLRFNELGAIPALIANDARFRKPVALENELLIQVKLLRNYKGRIGIFAGVVADEKGNIVAENISKGAIVKI